MVEIRPAFEEVVASVLVASVLVVCASGVVAEVENHSASGAVAVVENHSASVGVAVAVAGTHFVPVTEVVDSVSLVLESLALEVLDHRVVLYCRDVFRLQPTWPLVKQDRYAATGFGTSWHY